MVLLYCRQGPSSGAGTEPLGTDLVKAIGGGADDLVGLIRGDREAFRRIYNAYAGLLRFVIRRHGLSHEEAEEVMQDTFLKLFERASEIHDGARLKSWLVATARHQTIDRLRAKKRHAKGVEPGVLENAHEPLWQSSESITRESELLLVGKLVDRIAQCPGGETFRLFYVEGLSAKVIATKNGEAISTVTTRLSRLRERFRDELRLHIEALRSGEISP